MWYRNAIACYEQSGKYAQAEPLRKELVEFWKQTAGAESIDYARSLMPLGRNLQQQKKYSEAEALLRVCLSIRQNKQPDAWTTFETEALLGDTLLSLKKYDEAEPLLLAGFEGLKQREAKIPQDSKIRVIQVLEQIVELYDAWGTGESGEVWRKKLQEARNSANELKKQ